MNLFIIGNGFDLYHDLPTRYVDFVEYMKKNFQKQYGWFYDSIERYSLDYWNVIGKGHDDIIWSDMENVLGSFEALELLEEHRDWNSPIDYKGPPSEEIQHLLNFGFNVSYYLNAWLKEVETFINKVSEKKWLTNLLNGDEALILSFNYTNTIEQIYHLPVFHIHGRSGERLIMGHDNGHGGDIIGADFGINVINQKYIRKYFRETCKNPKKIMRKYSHYFSENNFNKVKEIYLLGHSLNQIDMSYINVICRCVGEETKWKIAYYTDEDRIYYQKVMYKLKIKKNNYKIMTWSDFENIISETQ